jgi:hypothetical protein
MFGYWSLCSCIGSLEDEQRSVILTKSINCINKNFNHLFIFFILKISHFINLITVFNGMGKGHTDRFKKKKSMFRWSYDNSRKLVLILRAAL